MNLPLKIDLVIDMLKVLAFRANIMLEEKQDKYETCNLIHSNRYIGSLKFTLDLFD